MSTRVKFTMHEIAPKSPAYDIDSDGFLIDPSQWTADFAEESAPSCQIECGLGERHWQVINFIRLSYELEGKCPLIYQTCRERHLTLTELKELFPTGYLRGACKLAGLSYRAVFVNGSRTPHEEAEKHHSPEKIYRVDVCGFLVDYADWDEQFARNRAREMKVPGGLSMLHRQIIAYLRGYFKMNGIVPTVYETCEANHIEIEELERLFPDGYHRGAVKLAGLRFWK